MEFFFLLRFPLFIFFFSSSHVFSLNSDGLSLLALKAAITTDPTHFLDTWFESDSTPCNWVGITCIHGRVSEISITNKGFNGYIPSELGTLVFLQRLSLSRNNFTKPIPSRLFNATSLISLDLSHNSLTGSIPNQIETLKSLTHLDLSSNLLNGALPGSLIELPNLTGILNLSYNRFSGEIPLSFGRFRITMSLDLRHNNLTGKIPQVGSLLNQGPTAFSGNPNLCGFPLSNPCPDPQNPRIPKISTNPNPSFSNDESPPQSGKARGSFVSVLLISGVSLIVGAVSVSVWLFRKRWSSERGKIGKETFCKKEKEVQNSKFVVMDEGFGLELEDLLRASAYVAGKSRTGIVYKVVVGRGSGTTGVVVAVRRLSECGVFWRFKEFESEVEAIGRVQHPNIVRLRAYYYASDEKLVVSDFIPNGSLYSALHGGPSNSLPTPLPWAVRLKIVQVVAKGLMHIHECSPRKYVHGNLKSSKILLDDDLQPYISGFGLDRLVSSSYKSSELISKKLSPTHKYIFSGIGTKSIASSMGYLAPEARLPGCRLTQKCDVYSFGIIVLEILTGCLPDVGLEKDEKGLASFVRTSFLEERVSQIIDQALLHEVYMKKQVIAAFHIALSCTEADPEMRPRMRTVSESLDLIVSH